MHHQNYETKKIVLAAVSENGYALECASPELRNNKGIVLAAISENGYALRYASLELRNNEKIVLTAVSTDACALKYAPEGLKNNEKINLAAVSNYGNALLCASPSLQNNRRFCSLFFTRIFDVWEIAVIKKLKLFDFKFNFNLDQIKNFKDVLTEMF